MKKLIYFSVACMFFLTTGIAQTTTNPQNCCEQKPSIEVTGSAEMEIVPDEIYITVDLQEWYDGKTKVTMEKMESDMFAELKTLNIDPKDISLSDAQSNFYYYWWRSDEALLSRSYVIMVNKADMVIKVYDAMSRIRANNAYISKLSHSKIEEYRMQTKVNATIAAKEKATKMLTAIGQQLGDAIIITEVNEPEYRPFDYSQIANVAIMEDRTGNGSQEFQSQVGYQKIKIRYEVYAKFAII